MFVFKVSGRMIYSAIAGSIVDQVRTAGDRNPKTPVEQALMRGLDTA
jgi:hypothetical protein